MEEEGIGEFVKRDKVTDSFEEQVNKFLNSPSNKSEYSSTFNPKNITECPRRIIYRSTAVKPNKPKTNRDEIDLSRFMLVGTSMKILNSGLFVSDCNYNLVGKLDYVIQICEESVATKIYVVDDETFRSILKKGAIRKNVVEVMVYMWLVELNNGLMVYVNKNTNKITSFHIKPYKPIIKSVITKCKNLLEHEFKGTVPDKPYKTRMSNECRQCEFEIECWEKQGEKKNA